MRFISVHLTREGNSEVREGFPIHKEPYLHILVGAPNREQKFERIPIGKKLVEEYSAKEEILKGSFLRTRDRETLVIIEEQPETEARAGVILYADPGFRGISLIESPEQVLASGEIWESPPIKKRPPPGTFTESPAYGVGHVVLAIACPGIQFKVTRTGRLYGAPEEVTLVFGDDFKVKALTVKDQEKERESEEIGNGQVL